MIVKGLMRITRIFSVSIVFLLLLTTAAAAEEGSRASNGSLPGSSRVAPADPGPSDLPSTRGLALLARISAVDTTVGLLDDSPFVEDHDVSPSHPFHGGRGRGRDRGRGKGRGRTGFTHDDDGHGHGHGAGHDRSNSGKKRGKNKGKGTKKGQ